MAQAPAPGSLLADAPRAARLRSWIVILGVLVIAAFAGTTAYDSWRSYDYAISTNNRELGNLANALAEEAEDTLQLSDLLLRDTVTWYETERPSPGSVANDKLAAKAAGLPQVREVRIIDEHGMPRFRSRVLPDDAAPIADRDYFIAHREHPHLGVVLSAPLITQIEHRPAVVMSRRIEKRDGTFDGIVQAVVDLEAFQRVYEAIDLGPGSAINLLREDGTLMVRQPRAPQAFGAKFAELVALGPEVARFASSSIDQKPRFVGVTHVAHFPLVVAVTREKDVALAGWRDEAYHVAARTLILMLLGALAIAAVVYQLRRIERGERALRQSEERYALAMEGANEGHFDWNLEQEGNSYVSPQMKLLHGKGGDASVSTREAWLAALDIHPEDVAAMQAAAHDHLEGRAANYETEYRVRHPDGEWHWLHARGRCVRDKSGRAQRFVGSAIDITARKNAETEKERLETQLRQSQKMEAMGTLAGGIAHDFNNILGAILGYGELAQKAAPEGGVVRRYLDNVLQAGGRAKALVERILAFSRSGVGERGPVNVQAVIEETLELLAASLTPGVRLEKRLEAGDAAIIGDASQLHQVAMNLCTNALQAMENGGVLEVALDRADVAQDRRLAHGILAPGSYIRLCVRDTGSGISPRVLERMFDPFFTTKGVGEGTGLGLSLVHGIVADLGGTIDVSTAVGHGTTFTIWLPIAGEATAPAAEVATELPHGQGQTVLVVDDEKPLVALAEEILAELGYEPIGFSSSLVALQAFREAPQRFEIVLTDETMPELVGTDFAREIRLLRPDIPIVLMSGYSGAQLHERAHAVGIMEVLRKPLRNKDIAECFGRVLRSLAQRASLQS
ncbi:MAG TPA: ATP-binding protein [Casimicrobiaceae bacterium]|jgi:PAS domain S-box-containing protein|nr:ATP-binding protein [Casimicrobiaceae bacterium]